MKKTLVIVALAMFSFANAQKGTILLAGSVGISSSKDSSTDVPGAVETEGKMNRFNFSPKVGYQFTDHLTVGIEASISGDKDKTTVTTPTPLGAVSTTATTKNTEFAIGPFLRYSQSLSDIFGVYADLGVGYRTAKETTDTNNGVTTFRTEDKGNGVYVGVVPALFINMKKGFGVNIAIGGLGYQTMNYDDQVDPLTASGTIDHKTNDFIFTFGQTFNIGISKNF